MNPLLAWLLLLGAMGGIWAVCLLGGAMVGFVVLVILNGFSERQAFPILVGYAGIVSVVTGLLSGAIGSWIRRKWCSGVVPAGVPVFLAVAFSLVLLGAAVVVLMPSSR